MIAFIRYVIYEICVVLVASAMWMFLGASVMALALLVLAGAALIGMGP